MWNYSCKLNLLVVDDSEGDEVTATFLKLGPCKTDLEYRMSRTLNKDLPARSNNIIP